MLYLTLKTIHVFAAVFWVGSLFLVCFVTSTNKMNAEQIKSATRITEMFIGITWILGIALVVMGSWYGSTWWQLKVILVVLISAIHSIVHRRWKSAGDVGASTQAGMSYLILGLTLLVILLVILKRPL